MAVAIDDLDVEHRRRPQHEVDRARAMEKAYRDAEAQGLGAVQVNGVMVDVAVLRLVRNTLDKADLYGL